MEAPQLTPDQVAQVSGLVAATRNNALRPEQIVPILQVERGPAQILRLWSKRNMERQR
jgi:hypothetical protein